MTTFLLIRHGYTDQVGHALTGHRPGISLNERGRAQAAALPQRLRNVQIDGIYSSPLERAMETAAPLASILNLPVVCSQRLTEIDTGDWTGRTIASLEDDAVWRRFNTLRSIARIPGGESMLEVQGRVMDELEELMVRHDDSTLALFSHQDTIKAALSHYAGMPLDLFSRFEIGPASISVLRLASWGPVIGCVNVNGELLL